MALAGNVFAAQAATDRVTFARDIAPVIFNRCASCHRPEGASFSLISYDEVKSRAALIARAIRTRFMPPWRPEPGHGEFAGDRRLSDREIALFEQNHADLLLEVRHCWIEPRRTAEALERLGFGALVSQRKPFQEKLLRIGSLCQRCY